MNSIVIKIYPPFSDAAGSKEIEINFMEDQINFKDLIYKMIEMHPEMNVIFPDSLNENNIYGSCFPVRGGKLLSLGDDLKPFDIIDLYGSLNGG